MNFLILAQLSVKLPDGTFSIADSGFNMAVGFAKELMLNGHKATVVVPANINQSQYHHFEGGSEVRIVREPSSNINMYIDARSGRYLVNYPWLFQFMVNNEIDILWNHRPEIGAALSSLVAGYKNRRDCKLVSMGFWLDMPIMDGNETKNSGFTYEYDQFSGFVHSDIVGFTCPSTMEAYTENIRLRYTAEILKNDTLSSIFNSHVFDFGFSAKEVNAHVEDYVSMNTVKPVLPRIWFANRLSPSGYTHHIEFFEACRDLLAEGYNFKVALTNPGAKMTDEHIRSYLGDAAIIFSGRQLTRAEYFAHMSQCNIGVSLFTTERYGGCAHREYTFAGLRQVVPEVYEYSRLNAGLSTQDGVHFVKPDLSNLKEVLCEAIKLNAVHISSRAAERVYHACSFEETTKRILEILGEQNV